MRCSVLAGAVATLLFPLGSALALGQRVVPACRVVVLEGEVRAGQGYRVPALAGIDVRLDPLASGWILRVVPRARPGEDWAEMATPPYRSVTPLAISTDWSFRAQDAIGWNPRRFRFAANQAAFAQLRTLRQAVEAGQTGKTGELATLVSQQPGALFEILDAHLVPGTADQTRAASLVAGHFASTAHELEQPAGGASSPLGSVMWLKFRVSLDLPPGLKAVPGRKVEPSNVCGGG